MAAYSGITTGYGIGVTSSPYTPLVRQTIKGKYGAGASMIAFKIPFGAIVRTLIVKPIVKNAATVALSKVVTAAKGDFSSATTTAIEAASAASLNGGTLAFTISPAVAGDCDYIAVTIGAETSDDTAFEVAAICDFTEGLPIEN